ncbi:MAG: hypothetical protein KC736_00800 [Candidatus Moranbacteria bacterium]|nr:hypothetical protein [Candidatus Moranbacteria bacterium]
MEIIPAILTDNEQEAISDIKSFEGVFNWVQIDVLDDTWIAGKTVHPEVFVDEVESLNIEVHLMVEKPEEYFDACKYLSAQRVYVHAEAVESISQTLDEMKNYPFQKGIAINPYTPVEAITLYTADIDAVLVMTVVPGKQGQEFMSEAVKKIQEIKKINSNLHVGVDGGVNEKTLKQVVVAGADMAAVGSAIAKLGGPQKAKKILENACR